MAGLAVGANVVASAQTAMPAMPAAESPQQRAKDLVAYGERSHFVTSVRVPVAERDSPDMFGMTFHVLTPLQDSVGSITPSSLHFVGTHRGAIVPDIDPKEYRLLIHGMVDHPLEFTLDELKRFPSVSRIHFLECLGNRTRPEYKTVQETHGLTSCSEWTGVPLSLLLKEVGVQKGASWIVSEGSEEVKGAGSIRLAKAMDDCSGGLRPKWRTAASAEWLPGAADRSRLRRNLQHQVAAANQGGRPLLHDLQRLRAHLEPTPKSPR